MPIRRTTLAVILACTAVPATASAALPMEERANPPVHHVAAAPVTASTDSGLPDGLLIVGGAAAAIALTAAAATRRRNHQLTPHA
jgi:hypothetical protein